MMKVLIMNARDERKPGSELAKLLARRVARDFKKLFVRFR